MRRLSLPALAGLLASAFFWAGCGPTYPKCDKDKDCHEKEFCVNGQCQQCRSDGDCKENEACNKGRCEARQACADDSACPSGTPCIAGVCKRCTADSECGEGGK